jgi:uncharacterized protein YbjT (DUF2867 family)
MINVIVFGATGMVGEGVVHTTLHNAAVSSVLVIGRRSSGMQHPKLKEIVHANLYDLSDIKDQLHEYHACYFCLGTSSLGKPEEEYRRITYDLTMNAASTLVSVNPGMTFCYISGEGTDSTEQGRLMWARVKGKTENDLSRLPFRAVFNFRPGFIRPIRGMKNTLLFAKPILFLYPLLKLALPSHGCRLEEIGEAMINVTLRPYPKRVLENGDIAAAARSLY